MISWYLYFGILFLLCLLYLALIGPALFKFWIVPRMEKRHNTKLEFSGPCFYFPHAVWGVAPMLISVLIIVGRFRCDRFIKNTITYMGKVDLKVVKGAGKIEIYFSYITQFFLLCAIISGIIAGIYCTSS